MFRSIVAGFIALLAIGMSGCNSAGVNSFATAECMDGTLSYSQHHSGTCSSHGGVAQWLDGTATTPNPVSHPSPPPPVIQPTPPPVVPTPALPMNYQGNYRGLFSMEDGPHGLMTLSVVAPYADRPNATGTLSYAPSSDLRSFRGWLHQTNTGAVVFKAVIQDVPSTYPDAKQYYTEGPVALRYEPEVPDYDRMVATVPGLYTGVRFGKTATITLDLSKRRN